MYREIFREKFLIKSEVDIMNETELQKETTAQNEQQSIDKKIILNILSNMEKHLSSIAYSLDYLVFNDKRTVDKSHLIPD